MGLTSSVREVFLRRIAPCALLAATIALSLPAAAKAVFPGANGRLAFASYGVEQADAYTMRADGSGLVKISNDTLMDSMPAWSADGARIAYVTDRDAEQFASNIWVMDADGANANQLTSTGSDMFPAWSPDDAKIAFARSRALDGALNIYTMDADGGNQQQITDHAYAYQPVWSPDGTQIVYTVDSDGLWIVNADGSDAHRLIGGMVISPDWSPDGDRLVCAVFDEGVYDIYTLNPDGSDLTRVAVSPAEEWLVKWSPDGTKFAGIADGGAFTMNIDGTNRTVLGHDPMDLSWQTLPAGTIAPRADFGATPEHPLAGEQVTLESSASDDNAIAGHAWDLDNDGAFDDATGASVATSFAAPGDHTVRLRVVDDDGLIDLVAVTLQVELPPQTTLTGWPGASVPGDISPFTFGSDKPDSSFECRVDDAPFAACGSPHSLPELPSDGFHTFSVRARDAHGHADATPVTQSFLVDTVPDTAIDGGPAGVTDDSVPMFVFSSVLVATGFECRIDGGEFAPCSSPHVVAPLADGPHNFEVRAKNAAGQLDPTPAARAFTVETVPDTIFTSSPGSTSFSPMPAFAFISDDANASFACQIDGSDFAPCTSPFATAVLGEGPHVFSVRATDLLGNTDASPASQAFAVDSMPDTSIATGPSGTVDDATPSFAFAASKDVAEFECRVDGEAFAPCPSPHTTTPLGDGPHTFAVRGKSANGATDPSPATRNFVIDTVPDTVITFGPEVSTYYTNAIFEFAATEPGSTTECKLDDGDWQPCVSPWLTEQNALGSHAFKVRATDGAGNTDATPAAYFWTIELFVAPPAAPASPLPAQPADKCRGLRGAKLKRCRARVKCAKLKGKQAKRCKARANAIGRRS